MVGRPDLFSDYEISGWGCRSREIYDEVVKRFPGTEAADDATWENAVDLGGECEGFIDCYVERSLEPLDKYRAKFPTGRHIADGVAMAVTAVQTNLPQYRANRLGSDGRDEWVRILKKYEATAAAIAPEMRAKILRALAPWWQELGEPAHAADLLRDAARGQ